ncbi:MAG: metallophosphoesterase [Myxococcales bacterium]|nr:metallophosphoesterase [Myxococcales bacterium]
MSPLRIVVMLLVMSSLTYGTHYYLWARLVRDAALPAPYGTIATVALVLLALSIPVTMIAFRMLPREAMKPLAWTAFLWMGTMFLLFVSTAGADLARKVIATLAGDSLADPAKRLSLARASAALAALVGAGLSLSGIVSAAQKTGVKPLRIVLPKLSARMSGYKIVQLTDVHIGPTLDRTFLERVVASVNAESPDLVVITGDLVDGSVAQLGDHVRPLADLRARDGVYFVTGNHEYYSGADDWLAYLRTLGVKPLRNERVRIGGDDGFDLAGVDDASAHQFGGDHGADYERALGGRDDSRPVVLLAHQPRQVTKAERYAPDLVLSGHTHGGQIAPIHFLVKLQQPYVAGLYQHGGTQVYVSRGTGYWGPPMRLAAPAEITKIELVRA